MAPEVSRRQPAEAAGISSNGHLATAKKGHLRRSEAALGPRRRGLAAYRGSEPFCRLMVADRCSSLSRRRRAIAANGQPTGDPSHMATSARLHSIAEDAGGCEAEASVPAARIITHSTSRRPAALYLAALGLLSILTCTSQQQQQQQPYDNRYRLGGNDYLQSLSRAGAQARPSMDARPQYSSNAGRGSQGAQVWSSRALVSEYRGGSPDDRELGAQLIVRRTSTAAQNNGPQNVMKSVRHIVGPQANDSFGLADLPALPADDPTASAQDAPPTLLADEPTNPDTCFDRLCYGFPQGCLLEATPEAAATSLNQSSSSSSSASATCEVLVMAKRFTDPSRPVSRDVLFELVGLPQQGYQSNYAAVGFSETGRMTGLVSECVQFRDPKSQMQVIELRHSYNLATPNNAPTFQNVPVEIISGIKRLGVSFENGHYQCRWIVESAVEFSYVSPESGDILTRREDLGYKSYHILLAFGEYDALKQMKKIHKHRVSSTAPVSLAQTGHIKSLGPHILIRIHGSLMIVIWIGFTTLSIILARYYKNEWANLKIGNTELWFVVHRTLMLASWFGTLIAIIFAFMYTETYHPGIHQISGSICLFLTTIQVLAGLFRPSLESKKRPYFNWTHFVLGNLSYQCAMICLITAAFLAPAQLPPLYIWIMVIFVATYALTHIAMTLHQYMVHRSSSKLFSVDELWLQTLVRPPLTPLENYSNPFGGPKEISITPANHESLSGSSSSSNGKHHHSNGKNNKLTSNGLIAEHTYPTESSSPFRQFIMGILVTVIVIFIVILISLVNIK